MKNRYLHLDYVPDADNTAEVLTANKKSSNRQNGGLDGGLDDDLELTSDENLVLSFIEENPDIAQKMLSEKTGKSIRTIQRIMDELKCKQILQRVGGKRHGRWQIMKERKR